MKDVYTKKWRAFVRSAAVLIVVLLAVNYITTIYNIRTISQQVDMISNHPFPVSLAAGKVNVYAARLRAQAERLEYSHAPERVDLVESEYSAIHQEMVSTLTLIREQYLTDSAQGAILAETYGELHQQQDALIALCRQDGTTDSQIDDFIQKNIFPVLDEIEVSTESILLGAAEKYDEFEGKASSIYIITLILTTILTVVVLAALFFYQKMLTLARKREEEIRQNLRDALDLAQNANAAKSQFLSNMSHDIRTPLNAIVGMTAIAETHLDDANRVSDCLKKITVASRHLLGLINDILDMSKIESGKILLAKETFSLPDFIQNFLVMIFPQAKAGQIDLDITISNIRQEDVIGDSMRLNQILLNIVGNAVKFTPPGGQIKIKFSELSPMNSAYGRYCFIIEDTGIGMSQEFMEKIFRPFERERTSTISRTEGTGLGMAITKNLVDMMNGEISVESEPGKGSCFTVILPLEWKETGDYDIRIEALKDLRAMVVDDDTDVCENTVQILEEIGMKSSWVTTGEDAVEQAVAAHQANLDYHTIIMDWKLPGIDGVEATRHLRKEVGPDTPIIILTAYDWSSFEEEAKSAGVTAFLSKPLFKSRLYHVMQEVTLGAPAQEKPVRQPKTASPLLKGRVLLAEDNSINMEIASEILKQAGVDSDPAWDGLEAVKKIQDSPDGYYQMILMDIQMPQLDGYGATESIRGFEAKSGRSHIPVIAMTANAFSEDMKKAYEIGMDGYITKPINIDEVMRVLRKYLS